jgi:hypothetical protein
MLAGVWVLVLMPALAVLKTVGWTAETPAPTFFAVQAGQSFEKSFLSYVYVYLTFCMGVVLLFAKEQHRQHAAFDWTRRWGVISSYGVLVLGFVQIAFIPALVILGIAALLQSLPRSQQPAVTDWFVTLSTRYIWHGPHPSTLSQASLTGFSAIVVLLACVPLFNAMRSSGPRVLALALLVPLALAAAMQFAYAGVSAVAPNAIKETSIYGYSYYLNVAMLGAGFERASGLAQGREFIGEAIKWLALLAIAIWLTIAQIAAFAGRGNVNHATRDA